MSSFKLMPDPLDLREIVFSTLLSLGFDPEVHEARFRIPFNRDMFSVPNRKAMEVVIHFLLTKLNKDSAKETFRHCWPISDKKQEQEFRKLVAEWINKIRQDDPDSRLSNVVPSLLLSPAGDKFYQFLFNFSTYVLKQKVSALSGKGLSAPPWPKVSSFNKSYTRQAKQARITSIKRHELRMISYLEESCEVKKEWMEFSQELSKEHRKLNKKRRECEKQLRLVKELRQQVFGTSVLSSKDGIERTQKLQKSNGLWKSVSQLYESQKGLQAELQHVFDRKSDRPCIDGDKIQFKEKDTSQDVDVTNQIPDILLQECEAQLDMGRRYSNVFENGKVNLTNLIQLWNLALHVMKETISHHPLPDVQHDEAYIRSEAHNHANSLNAFTTLKHNLTKQLLPDLQLSIEELKERIDNMETRKMFLERKTKKTPLLKGNTDGGLDLLPATPPVYFDPKTPGINSPAIRKLANKDHRNVETPDAVQHILSNLKKNENSQDKDKDATPVLKRNSRKKVPTSTATKTAKKFESIHQQQRHTGHKSSRIPLPKNNVRKKAGVNLFKGDGHEHERPQQHTEGVIIEGYREDWSETRDDDKRDEHFSKAQELLIDQIAQSVLNREAGTSRSTSDSEEKEDASATALVHALEHPIEAFSEDAFMSRDKVPRTPAVKKRKKASRAIKNSRAQNTTSEQPTSTDSNMNKITLLRERLQGLNVTNASAPNTASLAETPAVAASDLLALQERLRNIQIRGLQDSTVKQSHTPLKTMHDGIPPRSMVTLLHDITTPDQRIVSPIHESPYTPYRFSEVSTPAYESPYSEFNTPANVATELNSSILSLSNSTSDNDGTLKTPVNLNAGNTNEMGGDFTPVDMSNATESKGGCKEEQLLVFTPAAKGSNQLDSEPVSAEESVGQSKPTSDFMTSFLRNNKHLLDMTPTIQKKIIKAEDTPQRQEKVFRTSPNEIETSQLEMDLLMMTTPKTVNPTERISDYVTPFKDPFSPAADAAAAAATTGGCLNIGVGYSDIGGEVTNNEMDSFIEQVLAKTPAAMSKHVFNAATPCFLNDYSLMTPGGVKNRFNFSPGDDDDEENDDDEI